MESSVDCFEYERRVRSNAIEIGIGHFLKISAARPIENLAFAKATDESWAKISSSDLSPLAKMYIISFHVITRDVSINPPGFWVNALFETLHHIAKALAGPFGSVESPKKMLRIHELEPFMLLRRCFEVRKKGRQRTANVYPRFLPCPHCAA